MKIARMNFGVACFVLVATTASFVFSQAAPDEDPTKPAKPANVKPDEASTSPSKTEGLHKKRERVLHHWTQGLEAGLRSASRDGKPVLVVVSGVSIG